MSIMSLTKRSMPVMVLSYLYLDTIFSAVEVVLTWLYYCRIDSGVMLGVTDNWPPWRRWYILSTSTLFFIFTILLLSVTLSYSVWYFKMPVHEMCATNWCPWVEQWDCSESTGSSRHWPGSWQVRVHVFAIPRGVRACSCSPGAARPSSSWPICDTRYLYRQLDLDLCYHGL